MDAAPDLLVGQQNQRFSQEALVGVKWACQRGRLAHSAGGNTFASTRSIAMARETFRRWRPRASARGAGNPRPGSGSFLNQGTIRRRQIQTDDVADLLHEEGSLDSFEGLRRCGSKGLRARGRSPASGERHGGMAETRRAGAGFASTPLGASLPPPPRRLRRLATTRQRLQLVIAQRDSPPLSPSIAENK